MRKVIAAINMTLDGFCDHTAVIADDELHDHYSEVLSTAGVLLYGRSTYQLMEYWRSVLAEPNGNKPEEDFAVMIDKIPKIVFSRTLKKIDWQTARLSSKEPQDEIFELRQQAGKDIFIGSPGLIVTLTESGLIDEYQLCVHPIVSGSGLPLFKNITTQIHLELFKTKIFASGAIVLYYKANTKR